MGYRSDVTYIICFPSREIAKEFVAVQRLIPGIWDALDEIKYVDSTMPYIVGEFNCVVWDPEGEGARNHVALIDAATDQGFAWIIAKVGEDTTDVEIDHCDGEHPAYSEGRCSLQGDLWVSRTIGCYVDTEMSTSPVEFLLDE